MNSYAQRRVTAVNREIERLTTHTEHIQQSVDTLQQKLRQYQHNKNLEISQLQLKINTLKNYQQKSLASAQPQVVLSASADDMESTLIRAGNQIDLSIAI